MPTIWHLALSWRWNCSVQPKLWFLSLYVIGVSCTYDVFDQQFANFFTSFFATGEQGTRVFGYVTTMGELLNASIMFFAPLIINRIGGKNALLLAGTIMSVNVLLAHRSPPQRWKWLF
ncbi:MFS transporter [Escherichia coli]